MKRLFHSLVTIPALLTVLAGCETLKSSNPTSPSVAGPIAGVTFTAPKPVDPGQGASIRIQDQPITLQVENSSTNSQRTVTYLFEVATDASFSNRVFNRDGIQPGTNGRTAVTLPDALASDRTYYWRAKAADGANASEYSAPAAFAVVNLAEIETPQPLYPIASVRTSTVKPEFSVRNAARTGPAGAVSYTFEISETVSFTAIVAVVTIPEQPLETKFTLAQSLKNDTRYYWRARAFDPNVTGPWMDVQTFLTPAVVVVPPTPTPSPSPAKWPTNGQEVVSYATQRYPERLVAGVSGDQRRGNMEFIRDRMIEAGICGGMELAWNLKRGGPERSIDFLAYRKSGTWIGVDIGQAYDDTSTPLRLQWAETGPDLIFPLTYTPRPTCQ
jgi:hypothetical protein